MASLDPEAVAFEDAEILQAAFEMPSGIREATLPPGLHPTNPPLLIVLAWRAARAPWGAFTLVQARISCRSGVRPRGLVMGAITDNPDAAAALCSTWGLPVRVGAIELRRGYDAVELHVSVDGETAVHLVAADPEPLSPGDVQYTVTMTLANTPRGPRLVQLEPEYELRRVERVKPRIVSFDGSEWGEATLAPVHPVTATIAAGSITIPRLRYVCRPDVLAFEGTERVP
jgi:hypothetical protein